MAVNPKVKKAATIIPVLASSFVFLLSLAESRLSFAWLKEISNMYYGVSHSKE